MGIASKICKGCKIQKSLEDFSVGQRTGKDGRKARCKICYNEQARIYRKTDKHRETRRSYLVKNRERTRVWEREYNKKNKKKRMQYFIRYKYGIDYSNVEEMIAKQNNKCFICEKSFNKAPCIDHDHETGKVRGLLCKLCNLSLDGFEKIFKNNLQYNNTLKYLGVL